MSETGYLIDTHVLIWDLEDDKRISPEQDRILLGNDRKFVSIASIWEIAIKSASGKLKMLPGLMQTLEESDVMLLPIQPEHVLHTMTLPKHHNDPFDRLLISQAQLEGLTILTADRAIARYEVSTL